MDRDVTCYHCGRDWHDAELTQTVAGMFERHAFNSAYDPDTDTSPIVCIGSDAYGPAKPCATVSYDPGAYGWDSLYSNKYTGPSWQHMIKPADKSGYNIDELFKMLEWPKIDVKAWFPDDVSLTWNTDDVLSDTTVLCSGDEKLDIQLGQDQWKPWEYLDQLASPITMKAIEANWPDLIQEADKPPQPESPGIDYDHLKALVEKKPYTGGKKCKPVSS